jgi:hypothetical protein
MQGTASGGAPVGSDERNDDYDSIVSDLASLIEHIQASMKLIQSAIASEAFSGNEYLAGNVVVLDDVTPCYVTASAALNTCNAGLGAALHYLLDTRISRRGHPTSIGGSSSRDPSGSGPSFQLRPGYRA